MRKLGVGGDYVPNSRKFMNGVYMVWRVDGSHQISGGMTGVNEVMHSGVS